jgi:hypothetical protein
MRFAVASVLLLLFAGCVSPEEPDLEPSSVSFTSADFRLTSGYLLKFDGEAKIQGNVVISSGLASTPEDETCIGDIGEDKIIHFEGAMYQGVTGETIDFGQNIAPQDSSIRYLGGKAEDAYFIGGINVPESFELQVSANGPIEVIRAEWTCILRVSQLDGTSLEVGTTSVAQDLEWSIDGEGFAIMALSGHEIDAIAQPGGKVMKTDGPPAWNWMSYSTTFDDGASLEVRQIVTNGDRPVMILATHGIPTDDAWRVWT